MRAIGVLSGVALLTVAFTVNAVAAPADPFTGRWTSTDTDGSQQILTFGGSGSTRSVNYFDDGASVCGWQAGGAPIAGTYHTTGDVDGSTLTVSPTTGSCSGGGSFSVPAVQFTYDSSTNTLLDSFGVTWYR
jgi:hypothetical protein